MDLEVKGVAASPRRQAGRGQKCQGWRSDTMAARGPRPPGVPCLELSGLGDPDGEDEDSYTPCSGSYPQAYPQDSSPHAQQHQAQQGTELGDGDDDDFTALDEKALLQHCYTSKPYNMPHSIRKSEAEDVAAERRKRAVVEQVMADQLSRAVISDPEQSTPADVCKEAPGLQVLGMTPTRCRKRTLHETRVRTKAGLTANMLSNKLCFDSRILSRNGHDACRELIGFFFACDGSLTVYEFRQFGRNRTSALPFIQKGVYQHQRGPRKGKSYGLRDFYVGANLTFLSGEHNLPESCKQSPVLTLRVMSIDEAAMDSLKYPRDVPAGGTHGRYLAADCLKWIFGVKLQRAVSGGFQQECSKQVADDSKAFEKIRGRLRETLSKRGVRVLTGLGKYFRQADKHRRGFLPRAAFKEALQVFHLDMPEGDLEALWLALDDSRSGEVDYGEFTRAAFGEMSEQRKASVRKAYMKLDFTKTGSVPVADIRKCYCAKKHPLVLAGKATEEEIKSAFLETLGESCSSPTQVSYAEFEAYYEGLSFGIMDDDDFVNVLRNSWGI